MGSIKEPRRSMIEYGEKGVKFCGILFSERYKCRNSFCFWRLMNVDLRSVEFFSII